MSIRKKKLFILCDGTWEDGVNNKSPLTNVATFARCLAPLSDDGCLQLVYYDSGVGNVTSWFAQRLDGATGRGISAKIRNAYSFISHAYNFESQDPDEIILVGYSRDAFTVQCLASLINQAGLLRSEHLYYLRGLFTLWANQEFTRWGASEQRPVKDKLNHYVPRLKDVGLLHEVKIEALVVWDTVSALGTPIQLRPRPLAFVGKEVPGIVQNAFQALSLDEKRVKFKPRVWLSKTETTRRVKQCWFLGSHLDVGGNGDAALGAVTLLWIIGQLQDAGTGVTFEGTEIAKHLKHKFLEWDFKVNRFFGKFSETSVLSSRSESGTSTKASWYWWFLGMRSRNQYLDSSGANTLLMEIHFTVRLALASRRNKSAVLKKWESILADNNVQWKLGEKTVAEAPLIKEEEEVNDNSDRMDEYKWLKAWLHGEYSQFPTDRSAFANEMRGLILENQGMRNELTAFVEMLKNDMRVERGRLAPRMMYKPPTGSWWSSLLPWSNPDAGADT